MKTYHENLPQNFKKLTCLDIKRAQVTVRTVDLFRVDHVNQWLDNGDVFNAAHIKIVHILPEVDFFVLKKLIKIFFLIIQIQPYTAHPQWP